MDIELRNLDEFPDENKITGPVGSCIELWWPTTDSGGWTGPLKNWREEYHEFLAKVLKFDVIVQAGGCCGMYPRFYSEYFKHVYTFEPHPDNYACLIKNCVGNQYHIFNAGLGSDLRDDAMIGGGSRRNCGTYKINPSNKGDTKIYTIDSLNLTACDLIHLDVEGSEESAIIGALETIKKFKPVVIVERNKGSNQLTALGYKQYKKLAMDTIYYYE